MSIIGIVLVLAICGFFVWLILQIPLPKPFPQIIIGVICLLLVLWILGLLGVHTGLPVVRLW